MDHLGFQTIAFMERQNIRISILNKQHNVMLGELQIKEAKLFSTVYVMRLNLRMVKKNFAN